MQVAQVPVKVQVTQVEGHVMQEVLLLFAGFNEFPEHARQVNVLRYVFVGHVKQVSKLLKLHV
jgi:hypothetical protein